jgi:hypothetical protein
MTIGVLLPSSPLVVVATLVVTPAIVLVVEVENPEKVVMIGRVAKGLPLVEEVGGGPLRVVPWLGVVTGGPIFEVNVEPEPVDADVGPVVDLVVEPDLDEPEVEEGLGAEPELDEADTEADREEEIMLDPVETEPELVDPEADTDDFLVELDAEFEVPLDEPVWVD